MDKNCEVTAPRRPKALIYFFLAFLDFLAFFAFQGTPCFFECFSLLFKDLGLRKRRKFLLFGGFPWAFSRKQSKEDQAKHNNKEVTKK